MKTRVVIVSVVATMMALSASAQRAEYDDMYFTAKDREKNKIAEVEISTISASAKSKQKKAEEAVVEDNDNTNPTDSYSARNVNPEYVSRANSEIASEDERNYYVEGYAASTNSNSNFNYNNSYYNNANWARSSWYGGSPYYGGGYGMSPYYSGYNYDPWMMNNPYYGNSPYYGGNSGWSVSFNYTWGNYYSPYAYCSPYSYYGYNSYYNYPTYYNGGGYETSNTNYGKRPSRHSAVVTPTQRTVTRNNRVTSMDENTNTISRTRTNQRQEDYYVKPARRTAVYDNPSRQRYPSSNESGDRYTKPSTPDYSGTRTRDVNPAPNRENTAPSYSPAPSSSPSRSNGGSSGSGGSSPRPRGGRD